MRGSKLLIALSLVLAAVLARGLLPGTESGQPDPFQAPIDRVVEPAVADGDWSPDPEVRDPFEPIVLPEAPVLEDDALPADAADG